eukprot:CCRYP_001079-RB/>CCRYP_001079-RB protein AED:0.24 eAED:0.24 QI:365/1/1/1/0.33/0/4/2763/97
MYGTNVLKAHKRTHKLLSQSEATAGEVHHLSDNERDAGVGIDVSFQSKYVRASRPGSGQIASGGIMEMNHSRSKVAAVRRLSNCNPVGAHLKESSVG